jgi:hypothetical protein
MPKRSGVASMLLWCWRLWCVGVKFASALRALVRAVQVVRV